MSYAVKEIFYTLQGEGGQTGRASGCCLFGGCGRWPGGEEERASAGCRFCDPEFVGPDGTNGGRFAPADDLAAAVAAQGPSDERARRFVVCTGGEPLLQVDAPLVDALHRQGFEIA